MSAYTGHAYYRLAAVGVIVCFIGFFSTAAHAASWSDIFYFWSSGHKGAAAKEPPKVSFAAGSYFGDTSHTEGAGGKSDRFSAMQQESELGNLLSKNGDTFAFMTLRTTKIPNIKGLQVGAFSVGGLGAGFDDAGTQTIQVMSETVTEGYSVPGYTVPGYKDKMCRYVPSKYVPAVYVPGKTEMVSSEQNLTGSSDEAANLGGVELNVVFEDKLNFTGVSGLETFAGARFLTFGDSYSTAFSSATGNGAISSGRASVTNRLVGTQFGVSGRKFLSRDMMVTGRLALGLYANFLDQGNEVAERSGQSRQFSNIDDSDTGFAQMVEFSPAMHMRLQEKVFLSFGGTMMLLNGVRRASDGFSNNLSTADDLAGDPTSYFYYGGKATLKWTFN